MNNIATLPYKLTKLLDDPVRLAAMKANARPPGPSTSGVRRLAQICPCLGPINRRHSVQPRNRESWDCNTHESLLRRNPRDRPVGPLGYAINPARDLGPRIMHALLPIAGKGGSDWGYAWVPVVGPMIGAARSGGDLSCRGRLLKRCERGSEQ